MSSKVMVTIGRRSASARLSRPSPLLSACWKNWVICSAVSGPRDTTPFGLTEGTPLPRPPDSPPPPWPTTAAPAFTVPLVPVVPTTPVVPVAAFPTVPDVTPLTPFGSLGSTITPRVLPPLVVAVVSGVAPTRLVVVPTPTPPVVPLVKPDWAGRLLVRAGLLPLVRPVADG